MNITFYILGICFYKLGYPLLNNKIIELKESKIENGINNNKYETNGEKQLNFPKKKKKKKMFIFIFQMKIKQKKYNYQNQININLFQKLI